MGSINCHQLSLITQNSFATAFTPLRIFSFTSSSVGVFDLSFHLKVIFSHGLGSSVAKYLYHCHEDKK